MGATLRFAAVLALVGICIAEPQNYHTTPVPILKHINRHNEDGSYSYGYENADGSYKIETKHTTGEVFGKYGYVDDTGRVREVEYGASRRGFEPAGTDINVAPPTLHSSYTGPADYDDGQYREDPSVYYKDDRFNSRPSSSSFSNHRFQQPQRYNPPPPPPLPSPNTTPAAVVPPAPPVQPSRAFSLRGARGLQHLPWPPCLQLRRPQRIVQRQLFRLNPVLNGVSLS